MNLLGLRSIATRVLAVSAALLLFASSAFSAAREEVLHSFSGVVSGGATAMIFDSAGNLYGTANPYYSGGGVFKLSPGTNGQWTNQILYLFKDGYDGAYPSGLIMDSRGNLYGTTWQAGYYQCGTVFELSPNSAGRWDFSVLHAFDCTHSWGTFGVVLDAAGNLYGGTLGGGLYGAGTAFELARDSGGNWQYNTIFNFSNHGPQTNLVFDPEGNLYGANYSGLFELSLQADGSWVESSTYSFTTMEGIAPAGQLTRDSTGNIYFTNGGGGEFYYGTALRLSPQSGGTWLSTVVHSFGATLSDGRNPVSGLALDQAGNLYGTTVSGGRLKGGTVFRFTSNSNGQWTESILYNFATGNDGYQPQTGIVLDQKGNIYGATTWGGTSNQGVVFKVVQ